MKMERGNQVGHYHQLEVEEDEEDGLSTGPSPPDGSPLFPLMETRLYKRRWLMLLVFGVFSMSNAFMWLQYGIISNIFVRFYGVDPIHIDWLSMIYFLTYIPLILPVTWFLDNRGLRDVVVAGSAFNCIGAWIKTGTAHPDMFAVTFLGQFVCSVGTVFLLGIPSRLASLWFGQQEVSTACSIGVLGNQVCRCLPSGLKELHANFCVFAFTSMYRCNLLRQSSFVSAMLCTMVYCGCVVCGV